MDNNKLAEVIMILVSNDTTTTLELANQLNVSRRTINRYLKDMCEIGIPIESQKGINGGISIAKQKETENRIDNERIHEILNLIKKTDIVNKTNIYDQLLKKMVLSSINVRVIFEAECKERLLEEISKGNRKVKMNELDDGKIIYESEFLDRDMLLSWILSYQDKAILLKPKKIRKELRDIAKNIRNNYA